MTPEQEVMEIKNTKIKVVCYSFINSFETKIVKTINVNYSSDDTQTQWEFISDIEHLIPGCTDYVHADAIGKRYPFLPILVNWSDYINPEIVF